MKNTLLVVFCFFTFLAIGQDSKIEWGPEYKHTNKSNKLDVVGTTNKNLYVLKHNNRAFDSGYWELEQYDLSMRLEKIFQLRLPTVATKKMTLDNVLVFKQQVIVFASIFNSENEVLELYSLSFKNDSLATPIFRMQVENVSKKRLGKFNYKKSDNDSLLTINHIPAVSRGEENPRLAFRVFDVDFELLWGKDFDLKKEHIADLTNLLLDNVGNVYVLSNGENSKGKNENSSSVNYVLYAYYFKENKLKQFELELADKQINDVSFNILPNGNLVVGGFYSNTDNFSIAGSFYLTIDYLTRKTTSSSLVPFGKEFLARYLSAKKIQKGKELEDYYFDHFVINEDGSAFLVAEQYYFYQTEDWDYRSNIVIITDNYHFNDIIVVYISPEGQIESAVAVPKRQHTINDNGRYSSYLLYAEENAVFLIFNENEKNLAKNATKQYTMGNANKAHAVEVKVSSDGTLKKTTLFSSKEAKAILHPSLSEQLPNQLILYRSRGKKYYSFGILKQ